ncbi:MAG: nuclease-related domain-containing protein [Actinomycetota bacterium]|nr:NERD domain-containing protein [Actinomycetota bacterium]
MTSKGPDHTLGAVLDSLSGDGYRTLDDVDTGDTGSIDHVVFGPTGVFVLHEAPWEGKVRAKHDRLVVGREQHHDTIEMVLAEATAVKEHLWRCGIGMWAKPVLVCPAARVAKGLQFGSVSVVGRDDLATLLREGSRVMRPDDIGRCIQAFMHGVRAFTHPTFVSAAAR